MTNEEKANEIAKEYSRPYGFGLNSDSSIECYQSAMQAMQWKDDEWKSRLNDIFLGRWQASIDISHNTSKDITTIQFVKRETEDGVCD